ncbi:4-hydroxyphenylacetate catabolism regulatory protein HpaA [Geopseudomonas guangdongensis]|uniref:Transcriptional regulator, AraC family n=1 Tax=Geopseudomonas guangdongensis TaxID=1245526 RepID=A0A1H2EHG4_9GAMM|nr:4-hydroxyphenylacetate catabolism regulatory protein HpaA [Pseudomonas guangdongensis]MBP9956463.1 4-hydroxyphenylacetate catabolism regulatory protein HpaA [Pseudomonas sp.]SDT94494.1 transcriptional regulator, AraC family [Pseudomonas guangdongensis]
MRGNEPIPNINIGQVYDQRYADEDVHYEALGKLADFFGHNMPVHRHDRFFQLHYLTRGAVRVYLDDQQYSESAPLFFLTPPTIPHAFVTHPDSEGHVLTVRQQLVWPLLEAHRSQSGEPRLVSPTCVALGAPDARHASEVEHLDRLFAMLADEFGQQLPARNASLQALTQLIFIALLRLSAEPVKNQHVRHDNLQIFHRFNALIEDRYREHWPLSRYAEAMGVTEARLNDICRRIADLPSKRLVHERLMQEARRLLLFTAGSVNEIGYQLGFKDPAYFTRFFSREAGMTPSEYRLRESARA